MKKVSKIEVFPEVEEEFIPIQGDPNSRFTIRGTGAIPGEVSDFVPFIVDEEVPTDPEIPIGPTGPPGPEGFQGPTGPGGGGTAETWDSEIPTTATDFAGIPSGTVIELGTSSIDILKSMLYPLTISFTAFDMFDTTDVSRYYHIGDTIPQDQYLATWTLSGGDDAVEDSLRITQGGTELFTGGSPTEDVSTTFIHGPYGSNTETTITFTVAVTGAYNDTVSRNDSYYWRYPIYAGKLNSQTITESDFNSLLISGDNNPIINYTMSQLKSGVQVTVPSTSPTPQYFYWLVVKQINSTSTNPPNYSVPIGSFSDFNDPDDPKSISMVKLSDLTTTYYSNHSSGNITIIFDVYQSSVPFAGETVIRIKE